MHNIKTWRKPETEHEKSLGPYSEEDIVQNELYAHVWAVICLIFVLQKCLTLLFSFGFNAREKYTINLPMKTPF